MSKVIFFGVGADLHNAVRTYPCILQEAVAFADNFYVPEHPDDVWGKPVIRPHEMNNYSVDYIVLSSSKNFNAMKEQLQTLKVHPGGAIVSLKWYLMDLLVRGHILPKKVRLDVSTICQLNCKTCYMRTQSDKVTTGLGYCSYENFKKLIDDNPQLESMEISNNGEPFLNPDLAKMLEYAATHHVAITVENGTNFNTVSDELLDAIVRTKVRSITVSLDGTCQETYASYRQNGNFDKVIANLKKLNEYKRKVTVHQP